MAKDENFREYWVGLPVGVRVHLDGTVTWIVDTSEAGDGISEEWDEDNEDGVTEEQMLLDVAIANSQPAGVEATTSADEEMRYPVRYACGFLTANLGDMAAHILDQDEAHGA